MYIKNPYYYELMNDDNRTYDVLIESNTDRLNSRVIKSLKYDLTLNSTSKLALGGVYGATINLDLINFNNLLENVNFDNKEFNISIRLKSDLVYTVNDIDIIKVGIFNAMPIKRITGMWIPIGKFYVSELTTKEKQKITLKLTDKTTFLDNDYIPRISFPATLNDIVQDISSQIGIAIEQYATINENIYINNLDTTYKMKEILGYIAECECGYFIVNRLGNLQLLRFNKDLTKNIDRYKEFKPAENTVIVKKVKFNEIILGEEEGHTLELDSNNPFIVDNMIQNIYDNIKDFTYMPYTLKLIRGDVAQDILDYITITDTKNNIFSSYVFNNSWTFNGALKQDMSAKGENTLKNSHNTKGFIARTIEKIQKELIPNTLEKAIENATQMLTEFNGGYVIKKEGELFISDNKDLDKAVRIWRWNINGLGYSSTGINGPYGTAITMDGSIVANFITSGSMTADRIRGGTLKIGGINNTNGEIQVVDKNGNELVKINLEGITLSNGTKLIGGNGVLSNFQFIGRVTNNGFLGFYADYNFSTVRKNKMIFDVIIPNNFVVVQAYVTLIHSPIKWASDQNSSRFFGYSRQLKVKKITDVNFLRTAYVLSEMSEYDNSSLSDLNVLNFTASTPSDNSHKTEIVTSGDFSKSISSGYNMFALESDISTPNFSDDFIEQACYSKVGEVKAVLNVIGYMS